MVCCACTWVRLWQAPCRCRRCSLRQARAAQNEVPVTQQIELASMPLDDSYDGPRMEGARRAGRLPCWCQNACLCAFQRGPAGHLRPAAEPAAPGEPTLQVRCTSAARESLERARVRNLPLHRQGAMCLSGACPGSREYCTHLSIAWPCRQRGGRLPVDARLCDRDDGALPAAEDHPQAIRVPDRAGGARARRRAACLPPPARVAAGLGTGLSARAGRHWHAGSCRLLGQVEARGRARCAGGDALVRGAPRDILRA